MWAPLMAIASRLHLVDGFAAADHQPGVCETFLQTRAACAGRLAGPCAQCAGEPAKSGISSVADCWHAKREPSKLNCASNGNGTSLHLSAEQKHETFVTHIPTAVPLPR
jgi:hypothetical protein